MRRILFIITSLIILTACGDKDEPLNPDPKQPVSRTVLVYMIADNSLGNPYGKDVDDLNEMIEGAKGGALNGGRLLVYHNRPGTDGGNAPLMYEITERGAITLKTYPDDASIYSVQPERVREVIADMKDLAPASEYGLVLWSHANGWLGATSDNDITHYAFGEDRYRYLTIPSLAEALKGTHFSFMYFDCCQMGNVETLWELRSLTPVIAASPTELGIDGMPYDENLAHMFSTKPDMIAAATNTYRSYADNGTECQMTVIDTSSLEKLAEATRHIMASVSDYPSTADINRLQRYCKPGDRCFSYDMEQYMELLCTDETLLSRWRAALSETVMYAATTKKGIGNLTINHYCGLGMHAIRNAADITWRQYDNTRWWKDVVAKAPLYSNF